jgi:hypothetical protein
MFEQKKIVAENKVEELTQKISEARTLHTPAKSGTEGKNPPKTDSSGSLPKLVPMVQFTGYREYEIPDDSEEAIRIRAAEEKRRKAILTEAGLKLENPKEIIGNIYGNVYSKYEALENKKRMQEAGLKLYEWSTCNDERVRPSHTLMEGKICKRADPTVYSTDGGKSWKARPKDAPR